MKDVNICPQCHEPICSPHARVVHDNCGHTKCRLCLIKDEDGCQQCAEKTKMTVCLERDSSDKQQTDSSVNFIKERRNKLLTQVAEKNMNNVLPLKIREETKLSQIRDFKSTEKLKVLQKTGIPANAETEGDENCSQEDGDTSNDYSADDSTKNTDANEKMDIEDSGDKIDSDKKIERKRKPVLIASNITVSAGNPKTYTCTVCVKTFKMKQHIRYHNFCATGDKPHKCELCGQGFVSATHYKFHLRSHTGARPFVCEVCGKSFRQKDKLKRHMKIHSGERPFKCPTCGKAFITSYNLKEHQRTHTGEKNHKCSECGSRFADIKYLQKHLTVHSGEKNFICEDCGKSFGHKEYLRVHQQIHNRDRRFKCSECPRAFSQSKDLRRHTSVHSDSRPYSCTLCDTSFRRKDNLERHMKNTHPETRIPAVGLKAQDQSSGQQQQQLNELTAMPADNLEPLAANPSTISNKQVKGARLDSGNAKNSHSQISGCIKSTSQSKDSGTVKPYIELTVPPNLLRNFSQENVQSASVSRDVRKSESKTVQVTQQVGPYVSQSEHTSQQCITSIPESNEEITPISENVLEKPQQYIKTKETCRTLPSEVYNINVTNYNNALDNISQTDITGHKNEAASVQDLRSPRVISSVQDMSTGNYGTSRDPTVVSFKEMLDPVQSTNILPGGTLFQQIPEAKQQKSQAVPVINSPIATCNYTVLDYDVNPKTTYNPTDYPSLTYERGLNIRSTPVNNNYTVLNYDRSFQVSNISSNYPIINYSNDVRPRAYIKEKIIIEKANCVPTITKASNVLPTSVVKSNSVQMNPPPVATASTQRFFACKKTGKIIQSEDPEPYVPVTTRTLQSDVHWRKRTIELSQLEQEMAQDGFM